MALALRTLFGKNSPALLIRSFHASSAMGKELKLTAMDLKMAGYHKYGLLRDDLLSETIPDVVEAIRRLPEELQMKRLYRAIRASQIAINHTYLPKEEWTTVDDDHFYLRPYLDEVIKEREEREEWEANH